LWVERASAALSPLGRRPMIHVLRAPSALCGLCPDDCSKLCRHFEGPLGGFLLLAVVLNVPAAICALVAGRDPQVLGCTAADVATLCNVDLFLAVVHICFATYLKLKVEGSEASSLQAPLDAAMPRQPRFRRVRTGVRNMVLYDLSTCVYMLVFVGSAVWNIWGATWIQPCMITSSAPSSAVSLEIAFAVLSVLYGGCSVCFVNCMDLCEGVHNSRTVGDLSELAVSLKPLAAFAQAIWSFARRQFASSGRGRAAASSQPEAGQVFVGVPVAHPAPSAPPASFPVNSATMVPGVGAQAPDAQQALAGAVGAA